MAKEKSEKKKKRWILWVLILLLVAISGGVVGTVVTPKIMSALNSKKTTTVKHHSKTVVSGKQQIVPVKKFVINLTNEDGSNNTRYAQITLSLLVANSEQKAKAKKNVAVIRDSVINVIRQKTASDILGSADSLAGLKNQLRDTINKSYGAKIVEDVFITDLVIQ
ncbi:flagellar basal body-associated FliL family protein [Liquorilactobacillus mali]|uniref:Flagellar protein FliL n=1 Tax=Liquorilactobacillus mali TaxID=1618 RepID=A0A0R2G179_9LACO|nr:flagellar basal body-associated FliL family protein [Liquorilactobacillus mali]KRN30740.1 flagellar biosynthesis protein FliL [Liquorilactobacillus mali]MDN7145698.1 flagellar basal body-associated FliL family protein [Liquorilactobacillus mali]